MTSQSILHFQDYDFNAGHMHSSSPSFLHLLNNFAHQISSHHHHPRFDIEEHDQTYELYGDLPGTQQASLKIATVDDHTIEISGTTARHGVDKTSTPQQNGQPENPPGTTNGASDPLVSITHRATSNAHPYTAVPGVPSSTEAQTNGKAQPPPPPVAVSDAAGAAAIDGGPCTRTLEHQQEEGAASEGKVKHLMTERQSGDFHRIFPFTNAIREKEVSASFHNGVLHITVPKGPAPVKNHVEVYWRAPMF